MLNTGKMNWTLKFWFVNSLEWQISIFDIKIEFGMIRRYYSVCCWNSTSSALTFTSSYFPPPSVLVWFHFPLYHFTLQQSFWLQAKYSSSDSNLYLSTLLTAPSALNSHSELTASPLDQTCTHILLYTHTQRCDIKNASADYLMHLSANADTHKHSQPPTHIHTTQELFIPTGVEM